MKTKTLMLLSVVTLAFGAMAQAGSAAPYGRVGVDYTKFHTASNFDYFPDWKVGFAIEGGVAFAGAHSLGIELSRVEAKSTVRGSPVFKTKKQQMPVLVTYKYTHAFNKTFSIYGGGAVGAMMDKYSLDTTNPTTTGSATNWIPAAGVVAGAEYTFGGGWCLAAGVRVLSVKQKAYKDIGTAGLVLNQEPTYARPTFTLGIGHKW